MYIYLFVWNFQHRKICQDVRAIMTASKLKLASTGSVSILALSEILAQPMPNASLPTIRLRALALPDL